MRCPECLAVSRTGFAHCPIDGHELVSCTDQALIGTTIGSDYVLDEVVGEGATGLVFRAHHVRLPRPFAIKLMFGEAAADSLMRIRFAHEATAASQLSHPNVVAVVDSGRTREGLTYLVMEYVDGEPLSQLIAREAPLAATRTIEIAREIAQGLGHVHSKGLVHRDLKPANIVLESPAGRPPRPRILDFGLAISASPTHHEARVTQSGCVVGTPTYIAPEQARDAHVDHRADLYALGVVMYEMLAGKPPFEGSPADVAMRNMTAPVPPVAERSPAASVPPALEAIVVRLLQKKPESRYESAAALIAALDAAARVIEGSASNSSIAERPLPGTIRWWRAVAPWRAAIGARSSTQTGSLLEAHGIESSRSAGVPWSSLAAACALVAVTLAGMRNAARNVDPSSSTAIAAADGKFVAIAPPRVNRADVLGSSIAKDAPETARSMILPGQRSTRPDVAHAPVSASAEPTNRTRVRRDHGLAGRHIVSVRGRDRARQEASRWRPVPSRLSGHAATRALVREYRQVGEAIERLEIPGGGQGVRGLRDRYFRLRYSTALRDATVRRETLVALAVLSRDIQQASTRKPLLTAAAEQ